MRVVQVINSFGLDRGGAERLARGLHSDLLDLGADAHIIALEPCATDGLKNARSLGIANPRDPRAAIRLARALGSLATPDSVVHGHLFPTILHLTMLRRAGRIAAPCTMTEHNTWNKRRDSWLWRRLDRAIYSQFDRIAAISTQTRDALTTAHPQVAAKTVTVRNGAALRFVTPPERPDTSTPPTILTVARLARAKKIETALAALHQIADRPWSYVVAGDGALRPVLEARANELGIADRVTFLGNVTDVTELLRSADIFLLPSLWEGFGLAAVEAMNAALPVVASDVPGLSDIVAPAGNPVIAPDDVQGFAQALGRLIDAPAQRSQLGLAGFEAAKAYDKVGMARDYLAMWRDLPERVAA